ncbi:ComF family protein [Polycladidibacter hongkongensis]|uniref:ComF family protein n=1 Tax=Polycladidibacter hongkongensis TaxID=1647556 RepID=UPI00082C7C10|nr:ComF family protein [Pseudovibrio hongkongensis]
MTLKDVVEVGVNCVWPPTCAACRQVVQANGALCQSCWAELQFLPHNVAGDIDSLPGVYAAVCYDGVAQEIVKAFKFRQKVRLGRTLGALLYLCHRDLLNCVDCLVPVPLHRQRLFERGYNQSALLAKELSLHVKELEVCNGLVRNRKTSQQIGLSRAARWKNLSGSMVIDEIARSDLAGKRVLLVDDVYTSGATLHACTRALQHEGVDVLGGLVFARALPERMVLDMDLQKDN